MKKVWLSIRNLQIVSKKQFLGLADCGRSSFWVPLIQQGFELAPQTLQQSVHGLGKMIKDPTGLLLLQSSLSATVDKCYIRVIIILKHLYIL